MRYKEKMTQRERERQSDNNENVDGGDGRNKERNDEEYGHGCIHYLKRSH